MMSADTRLDDVLAYSDNGSSKSRFESSAKNFIEYSRLCESKVGLL
ncbi:MAG: hypothetical protein ACLR8Y_20245 [Alistipes indistinctus]